MAVGPQDQPPTFALQFPLPFRISVLITLGVFVWACNLHGLHLLGINATSTLGLSRTNTTPWTPIYRLAFTSAAWCTFCWVLFSSSVFDVTRSQSFLPFTSLIGILVAVVIPLNFFCRKERQSFLRAVKRCLLPRTRTLFCDIMLADFLTSYSKVFGDLWFTIWTLVRSTYSRPGNRWELEKRLNTWLLPCAMSLPYLVRFRQCSVDFLEGEQNQLYNALKYITALPVIFLSFMIPLSHDNGAPNEEKVWFGENQLFRLWLLSAFINSLYSFWWDITNDWGLMHFKSLVPNGDTPTPSSLLYRKPQDSDHELRREGHLVQPAGLRQTLLLFRSPLSYYGAIFLNFILRLTWSIKLSPHFHRVAEREMGVFILELLEILRRWIWVYLRVEWETIKLVEASERAQIRTSDSTLEMQRLPL